MRDTMDAYEDGGDDLPLVVHMRSPREKINLKVKPDKHAGVAQAHWVEVGRPRDRAIPFHRANGLVTGELLGTTPRTSRTARRGRNHDE
jgi:hypothetical protein